MKCNAMRCDEKTNEPKSGIGLLVFYESVMNERSVAVSTVTESRMCGCFSKPTCDYIVTSGWQQLMNAIRWIKLLAEKKSRQSLSRLSERDGSSAYCNATQYGIDGVTG